MAPPDQKDANALAPNSSATALTLASWRSGLPVLTGSLVAIREVRPSDAQALRDALITDDVTRFISPPPPTVGGFETFVERCIAQRVEGQYACFAIVPRGSDSPIGLFHVRALEPRFSAAEWGFAIAPEFWGTGVFIDAARLVAGFIFSAVGTHRLEARVAVQNARANGALRKLGATPEAVLRHSFFCNGQSVDQTLWTIVADDWPPERTASSTETVH